MAVISPNTFAAPCRPIQSAAYSDSSIPIVLRITKMMTNASPVI